MYLTEDQWQILAVLKETRCLRPNQALRLLRAGGAQKTKPQVNAALRQLRYMGELIFLSESVVALPECRGQEPDGDMLDAVDVMLDLTGERLEGVAAHRAPFLLRFLATRKDGRLASFALLAVESGREAESVALAENADGDHRAVVFLLRDIEQRGKLRTALPHYFAIRENGRFRYFKGGEA